MQQGWLSPCINLSGTYQELSSCPSPTLPPKPPSMKAPCTSLLPSTLLGNEA